MSWGPGDSLMSPPHSPQMLTVGTTAPWLCLLFVSLRKQRCLFGLKVLLSKVQRERFAFLLGTGRWSVMNNTLPRIPTSSLDLGLSPAKPFLENQKERNKHCASISAPLSKKRSKPYSLPITVGFRGIYWGSLTEGCLSDRCCLCLRIFLPMLQNRKHTYYIKHTHTQYSDGQEPGVSTTPLGTQ